MPADELGATLAARGKCSALVKGTRYMGFSIGTRINHITPAIR